MFGLAYDLPRTAEEFVETYRVASTRNRPTLIEVRTDREENTELHRELLSKISEATR
jgi:2-succinyl-5-enolpyruvyl-6-hydroxy-3-cyclohexene-1-carboxylate synthase